MFAGHAGAALAIARIERRVNVGLFVAAALLLDFVLWLFVLLGWESIVIPSDFASTHQAEFVFPYSHGLAASVVWSVLAAVVTWAAYPGLGSARTRAAILIAAAVFSHWLLDALVHRPELPLLGATSQGVGLGLWNRMPIAVGVESAIAIAGMVLFIVGSGLPRGKLVGIAVVSLAILAFTGVGMSVAPPPPSASVMAGSSLAMLVAVCALFAWLGRQSHEPRI
jgi:membrane-bound metal-dependent hydrolase YbcI (DUF457 family)